MKLLDFLSGQVPEILEDGSALARELKRLAMKMAKPELQDLGLQRLDPFSTEGQIKLNQARRLREAQERAARAEQTKNQVAQMLGPVGPKSALPEGSARWSGQHPNEMPSTASPTSLEPDYHTMSPEEIQKYQMRQILGALGRGTDE